MGYLASLLHVPTQLPHKTAARMPLSKGGWVWAVLCDPKRQRHPDVADTIITRSERDPALCFRAVKDCDGHLCATGFESRPWVDIAEGARPGDSAEDGVGRRRQPRKLSSRSTSQSRSELGGVLTKDLFVATPTNRAAQFDPQPLRVMSRRLRLPMPLSSHSCRCGRLLDNLGHHRAVPKGGWARVYERHDGGHGCPWPARSHGRSTSGGHRRRVAVEQETSTSS